MIRGRNCRLQMKRSMRGKIVICVVLAAIPLTVLAADASAAVWEWSWRLGGGSSIPVSPENFDKIHSAGLDLDVGLGARIPRGLILLAVYDFNRFFVDENGVTEYVKSLDPSWDPGDPVDSNPTYIHTIMAMAVLPFTASLVARPYVLGGVGWMWLRPGDITYSNEKLEGTRESAFATTLGAGVEFRLSPSLNAFLEAAWTVGFTDETIQFVPIRFGVFR